MTIIWSSQFQGFSIKKILQAEVFFLLVGKSADISNHPIIIYFTSISRPSGQPDFPLYWMGHFSSFNLHRVGWGGGEPDIFLFYPSMRYVFFHVILRFFISHQSNHPLLLPLNSVQKIDRNKNPVFSVHCKCTVYSICLKRYIAF